MIKTVLVTCVGNICRSPVGERLLDRALRQHGLPVSVSSAGIAALEGRPVDQAAAEIAEAHGLSLEGHVARQFTEQLGRSHDLILVMENAQKSRIIGANPELTGKIMLFDQWTGASGIRDPFRQSREFHQEIYVKLSASAESWGDMLRSAGER